MSIKQELIKISQEISKVLKEIPEVKAIALGGGIVSGEPDKYSDVDIYCFCDKLPDIQKRKKIIEKLKLDRIKKQYNQDIFPFGQDLFFYKKKAIGVDYIAIDYISKKVKEIQNKGYITNNLTWIASKIFYNRILFDPKKIFTKYLQEIEKYKLNKVYAKLLWSEIEKFTEKIDWAGDGAFYTAIARKNHIWIAQYISMNIRSYLFCLYTLNDAFFYEHLTKWSYKHIPKFKIKPKNCVKRLEQISKLSNSKEDLRKKIKIFSSLLKDTSPLIKKKFKI